MHEEADALTLRTPCRAARAAKDTSRMHGKHEAPIEAWIAIAERLPAVVEIEHCGAPWMNELDSPPWLAGMPIRSTLSNLLANMEAASRLP